MNSIKKLLVIILATLLLPTMASATQILRYTDHEPLGGMRTQFIKDVFFSAIEKESNGRLRVEAHWGSEISTGYDALRILGEGSAADIGIVVPEYSSNDLPLHQIFKSFPVGPTGDKQVEFFRRVYTDIPAFSEELKQKNVVNLYFGTGFPVAFLSTKPLNTLKDIKGETWRSASFWHKDFLQNAGATPVSMPWGEGVYKALKDGSMDGVMVNVDSGYDIKAHEVAPNVVVSKDLWLGHVYLLVMNQNTWDGLKKEDQEAIKRAAEIAYRRLGAVMNSSFDAQIADMKKAGVRVRILAPEELKQWETMTKYQKVQRDWVKAQEDKGVKDVGSTMEKVRVIMGDVLK